MVRNASWIGALLAVGIFASTAFATGRSSSDPIDDSSGSSSHEITLVSHGHRNQTTLEHQVYVKGEAERLDPPTIYFDIADDQEPDFVFRRQGGQFEVVRMNGTRSKEAKVKKISEHGLSIRFTKGALSSPQFYSWYVAYKRNGNVLDRADDDIWIYHNLSHSYP